MMIEDIGLESQSQKLKANMTSFWLIAFHFKLLLNYFSLTFVSLLILAIEGCSLNFGSSGRPHFVKTPCGRDGGICLSPKWV